MSKKTGFAFALCAVTLVGLLHSPSPALAAAFITSTLFASFILYLEDDRAAGADKLNELSSKVDSLTMAVGIKGLR